MKKILLVITVVLMVLAFPISAFAADADTKVNSILADATEYNGNYYLLIKGDYTWEQAKTYCEGLGGHLATITSQGEDDICFQMYKSSGVKACWLGASDATLEGVWKWITDEQWSYSNWGGNEPNGGTGENVLNYYGDYSDGRWNDSAADGEFPFICEWESEDVNYVRRTYGYVTSSGMIYNNAFYFNGNVYKVFEYDMSYEEAKAYCEQLGGHLATITSKNEDKAIFTYISKMGNYNCILGGSDARIEGLWEWITGETFSYANWADGEPNDQSGEDYLQYGSSGKWNDIKWKNCFLCEWDNCCILEDGTITEHSWGEPQVVKEATCTTKGENKRICSGCAAELLEDTEMEPHTLGDWEITSEATCHKEGLKTRSCEVCEYDEQQSIDLLEHEWSEWSVSVSPTCHTTGINEKTCKLCNDKEQQSLDMLVHEWSEWSVAAAATCHAAGTNERICKLCNDKEQQPIEQLTHNYGEYVVVSGNKLIPPIVKEKTCSLCGDVQSSKDWSNIWITIIAVIALLGVGVGVFNYIRGIKKSR